MNGIKTTLTESQVRRLDRCISQAEFDSVMMEISRESLTVDAPVYAEVTTLSPAGIERSMVQIGMKQVPMFNP